MIQFLLVALTLSSLFQDASSVTLDFLVTGRDGAAITDLSPADVELKVGGKVRPILSLDLIAPQDGGRTILLIVDEATLYRLEPVVKEGVTRLLASLQPGDTITYLSTRRSRTNLTPGKAFAASSVESMVAGPGELYTCLADMLTNIESFAKRLPAGRGSTLAVIARGHPEGAASGSEGDAAPCTPRRDQMRQAAELLAARQINLLLFTASDTSRSEGFDTLASNTGGSSHLLTWADTGTLERAIASTRTFYRATIAADRAAPERPQRVQLRVKRPRVKITTVSALALRPSAAPAVVK